VNYAETVQDRPGNLRMKCSALNVDFNGVRFDPLGSRRPPYERIKFGTVLKTCDFCYCSRLIYSTRMVADRHRLAAYHNKHSADEVSGGIPRSISLNDFELQKYGF